MMSHFTAGSDWSFYQSNWLVGAWYLDQVVGNDGNSGLDAAHPLRTGAELLRRLGPFAIWPQSVTVTIGTGGLLDSLVLRGMMVNANTHVDVIGTATVLANGTLATYAAHSHVTRTATRITSAEIADWTPYQGRRILFTSGVGTGGAGTLTKANPGGVGVATTELSRPCGIDTTSTTNLAKHVVPVVGNTFEIQTLPTVPSISLSIEGACARVGTAQWPARRWSIQSVDCPLIQLSTGAALKVYSRALIWGSKVGVIDDGQCGVDRAITERAACNFAYLDPDTARGTLTLAGECLDCAFTSGGYVLVQINDVFTSHYSLFENTYLWIRGFGKCRMEAPQFFDGASAVDLAIYCENAELHIFDASGDRNAGYGIGLDVNAKCRLAGTIDIRGTAGTGALVWPTWIPLTYAQMRQPADYAQKGVSNAMVAGSTTVTVPWYNSATQKPQATHATHAGTVGILRVTTLSDTQFRIDSSSALDTSTVNWYIPPLGRNILITSD